jgi:substrate-assisted peptide maturase DurN-like protein
MVEDTVTIRQIQGYMVLLSCLPANGKVREVFELALACDEGPWLDKVGRPSNPDDPDSYREWLEGLWAQGGLTPEEQAIVDWQNNSDNMSAAVAEWKALAAKLSP